VELRAAERVKKFPADVENLQLKDAIEEFLDCCKETMHDDKVPKTILVRDRIPFDPVRRGRSERKR
jgi:hypothetical protein